MPIVIQESRRSIAELLVADHFAASRSATATHFGAALTVIHVMRIALFRAPVADVRAHCANLLGERTVAGDRIGAQPADSHALDAASWASIVTFFADHVRKTISAFSCAVVAGGNAVFGVLIQMMTHDVFPYG